LFHKAVAQSGTGICPWSLVDDPDRSLEMLANQVNCTQDSMEGTLQCLKTVSAVDLARTAVDFNSFAHPVIFISNSKDKL